MCGGVGVGEWGLHACVCVRVQVLQMHDICYMGVWGCLYSYMCLFLGACLFVGVVCVPVMLGCMCECVCVCVTVYAEEKKVDCHCYT